MKLAEYVRDPCRSASLPWWKQKSLVLPAHMRVVHEEDFKPTLPEGWREERYFRLIHHLENISAVCVEGFALRQAREEDIPIMAQVINQSYDYLAVSREQLTGYRRTPVFDADLWLLVVESATGRIAGCGIADFDPEAAEGILEWIQILPEYRRRGLGRMLVSGLLSRMTRARFATVSGRADDPNAPERLYRSCGFEGDDLWHILYGPVTGQEHPVTT